MWGYAVKYVAECNENSAAEISRRVIARMVKPVPAGFGACVTLDETRKRTEKKERYSLRGNNKFVVLPLSRLIFFNMREWLFVLSRFAGRDCERAGRNFGWVYLTVERVSMVVNVTYRHDVAHLETVSMSGFVRLSHRFSSWDCTPIVFELVVVTAGWKGNSVGNENCDTLFSWNPIWWCLLDCWVKRVIIWV